MDKKLTEDELRKQILEFLKKDPRVTSPKLTHGTHEYGVDIVFDYEDVFGQKLKCGIQVKVNDLDASKLKEIIGQLCIAFGHEYSRKPNTRLLDIVYIITNGSTQPSDEYINASNVGFRNVMFIDGDQLKPLLEQDSQNLDYKKET